MAGRGRAPGFGVLISAVVAVCALLVSLVGCGGGSASDRAEGEVRRLLDRRAAAVLDRDLAAYRSTGSTVGFGNLRSVPLAAWSYELTGLRLTGDTATADARLRYRLDGYDPAPVVTGRVLKLARDADGAWDVVSDRPAHQSAQQPWDQGPVRTVRGERSLVLGIGQSPEELRGYAELADRAVPAVTEAWGTRWSRRVVVVVPESLDDMAALLGSPASAYRGIAAVTTGEVGARATADRIIVNPDAYGVLGAVGRQVVLTHETTHVATRAHTHAATPLWLSEGYADWAGYRGTGRTPAEAAPELARTVAEGRGPRRLPTDEDFAFTGDAAALAQAYEGGWLACRLIAENWGEDRLGEFYRAVGAHPRRAGAVEGALREVLGITPEEFTERWRAYLRVQFG
ncbi:hypothetical protein [Streptomyces sp. NPDC057877]|uniref:hypothetical protein n=1 Tax=Streptomyces sp. NPDC057877 TaxID=3346269 RepID=UPI0036C5A390